MKIPTLATKKHSLRRKLFACMVHFAILLCTLLIAGLYLIGSFTSTKQKLLQQLEFQAEIFERQLNIYYDSLAVMSIQLSTELSEAIDGYLEQQEITFELLNDSQENIEGLQTSLIERLRHKLWEADCTGAFVVLEAQVNSSIEDAEFSRTGIYLQRNSLEVTDTRVLLYRGLSNVGKEHDCMPHRKWRLEFSTKLFPNYDELKENAAFPLYTSYRITDVVLLPGTDRYVMLMTVPILSDDGSFLGLCGFELNEDYFKQVFAQPSELDHAVFCISKNHDDIDLAHQTLSAGVLNEYYLEPRGVFVARDLGEGLIEYKGKELSYIGITSEIRLCPGECVSALSVIIPKRDYDRMLMTDTVRTVLLSIVFTILAVILALFFTRRYIKPIMQSLDSIRNKEYEQNAAYATEIRDLFAYLAEQDRTNEAELAKALDEKQAALTAVGEMRRKYDEAAKENERLAYSRKDEIDPYDFENFKLGLKTLTAKENEVLNMYIDGKTVKDITAELSLQESTVRFHNKNIYSKLGVHSLKQLLRYVAVLRQDGEI